MHTGALASKFVGKWAIGRVVHFSNIFLNNLERDAIGESDGGDS